MAADASALRTTINRLAHQYPKLAAKREGAELFGAPRLNSFTLFRPNEVRLSRIIADLFDPSGAHGQDTLFLNALLKALALPRIGVVDPVSVRREMVTKAGRQIDLVIETPNLIVGIENKPWAAQQPEQLADYLAALNVWSRGRRPVLIFLSNKEPETAKDEVEIVRLFSEDSDEVSLNRILLQCRDGIKAQRTRTHIEEMLRYLASEFGDETVIDQSDVAFVEAVEAEYERGTESRRAIAMTMIANASLHERIITDLGEGILTACKVEFPDIEEEDDDWSLFEALSEKHNWWALRRPNWPDNCSVAISPGRTNFGEIFFGVRAPDGKKRNVEADHACSLRKPIADAVDDVEGGSSDACWPWWKYAEPISWTSESVASLLLQSPNGRIVDHPRMTDLIQKILALVSAVDRAVGKAK